MQIVIKPSMLEGKVHVPASKSMMQRMYAAALLHQGKTVIRNVGRSDDDRAAKRIIEQLGAKVNPLSDATHEVVSGGVPTCNGVLHCGESGLSTRMFTIIAALCEGEITVTGEGSLLQRSMQPFVPIFEQLGVAVLDFEGTLPITLKGPMQIKDVNIDGSLSSQFLSGLLIAYAFTTEREVTIRVDSLVSRPYIDMTLDVISRFGKKVMNEDYKAFIVSPPDANQGDVTIDVEGDWSSAAYWLVAKALGSNIEVNGVDCQSKQADRRIVDVLERGGLKSFSFDATHAPDLFPILSVYAACCEGESKIEGLHRLTEKESNRAETIQKMLTVFSVPFEVVGNALMVKGVGYLKGGVIDSYNDHRIAMAAAIGALKAEGQTTILNAEAVAKSYPHFFDDFKALGGNCIQG